MAVAAWMLDTNVLSDLIRDPHGVVASRVAAEPAAAICTSIVVACELRFGAVRKGSTVLIDRVDQLLDRIDVLPLDTDVDRHYAALRTTLESNGTPIGSAHCFADENIALQRLPAGSGALQPWSFGPALR